MKTRKALEMLNLAGTSIDKMGLTFICPCEEVSLPGGRSNPGASNNVAMSSSLAFAGFFRCHEFSMGSAQVLSSHVEISLDTA